MKLLYYLCIPLKWPFLIVGGVIMGLGWCISMIGDFIEDEFEYRCWRVLHDRERKAKKQQELGPL